MSDLLTPSLPSTVVRKTDADGVPRNKQGRLAHGLYPYVSRKGLGLALGVDIGYVSSIFRGRSPIRLDLAVRIANLIGVPIERLNLDLEEQRQRYKAELKKRRRKAITKGRKEK